MKHLEDTMKNLQKLTESLSHLQFDYSQPMKALGNMQEMFDGDFWGNLVQTVNHAVDHKQSVETADHPEMADTKDEDESSYGDEEIYDLFVPNVDIFQTPNKVIVCCEAPGLERNSMEMSLSNSRKLLLKGHIRRPTYSAYLVKQERYYGHFEREIKLPQQVTIEGLKSLYVNGILELHFYKRNRKTTSKEKITINFGF